MTSNMNEFKKRIFKSLTEFKNEFKYIFNNRDQIKKLESGDLISDEFRQRLMMVVTEVNGCRYCSYYHSKLALKAGITNDELDSLLGGNIESCPEEEKLALIYAQHWTENGGKPDEQWQDKIIEEYGGEKAEIINLAIRMINFGNLSGNTFDYFLYKITFGLLGQKRDLN